MTMQSELVIASSWRAKPRGFIALMQLYESNYLRLHQLCGDPARLTGELCSRVGRDCDLRINVLDRSAYTVTLQLTHLFGGPVGAYPDPVLTTYPDVRIRAYCDARLVQAQEWADAPVLAAPQRGRAVLDRELHQRWSYNIMLNKWLEYCLDLGHRFA